MNAAYERIGTGRVKTADETAESRKRVRGFWNMCDDARGTPVAKYLGSRGLSWLTRNDSIRYRVDCSHPSGKRFPAMVALIWDGNGDICALHRTYLNLDGTKADVDPVKASLGSFLGGAIRISPAEPEMVIAEGLETAASAGAILGLPAWSAIACGNLRNSLVLPPIVRSIIVAADHDGPGRRAAHGAAARWKAEGRSVRIATPDQTGADFNDLYRERLHA